MVRQAHHRLAQGELSGAPSSEEREEIESEGHPFDVAQGRLSDSLAIPTDRDCTPHFSSARRG